MTARNGGCGLPMPERVRLWERVLRELISLANATPNTVNAEPDPHVGNGGPAGAARSHDGRAAE